MYPNAGVRGLGAQPADWLDPTGNSTALNPKYINMVLWPDGSITSVADLLAEMDRQHIGAPDVIARRDQRAWGFIANANRGETFAGVQYVWAGNAPATGGISIVGGAGTNTGGVTPVTGTVTPTGYHPAEPPAPGQPVVAPSVGPVAPETATGGPATTTVPASPDGTMVPTGDGTTSPFPPGGVVPSDGGGAGGGEAPAGASIFGSIPTPVLIAGAALVGLALFSRKRS